MTHARELKIVFTGPMGAGKTTAIAALSDVPPVRTEAENLERDRFDKDSTTVALDFGQIALPDGTVVQLYGTPGQERFRFMWEILGEGALGVVLLLDASADDALAQLHTFVEAYASARARGTLVVGLGRTGAGARVTAAQCAAKLRGGGPLVPVFSVDVRRRADAVLLVETLLCQLEAMAPDEAFA